MAFGLDLGDLLVHLRADASQYESTMKRAVGTMTRTVSRLGEIGARWTKRAGVALGAYAALSVKAFGSFQEQMTFVSTMLNEHTMKLLPSYGRAIQRMAIEFGEGTATLAQGLYNVLSASIPAEQAINTLTVAVKAAQAGMTDTATATYAITGILNAYGMTANEAERVSDILFATVKRGQTTFAQLAPSVGRVTAIAAEAGVQFEQVAAALATITRGGISTEEAVTGLRQAIITLQGRTEDAVKIAREHGIELSVQAVRSKQLGGMVRELANLSSEVRKEMFKEVRARVALNVLIENQAGLMEDLKLAVEATGLTQEAYDKMTATLNHTFRTFWQTIKVTSVEIGSHLAPTVDRATKAMREWLSEHQVDVARAFVRTLKALAIGIEKIALETIKVSMYWKEFVLILKQVHLTIEEVLDSVSNLDEIIAWIIGDYSRTSKVVIPGIRAEIEKLKKETEDLAVAYIGAERKVGAFFDTLTRGFDKTLSELERGELQAELKALSEAVDKFAGAGPGKLPEKATEGADRMVRDYREAAEGVKNSISLIDRALEKLSALSRERTAEAVRESIAAAQLRMRALHAQLQAERKAFEEAMKREATELERIFEDIAYNMARSFSDAYDKMIFEGKRFTDTMRDMLRGILRMITEIIVYETISKPLAKGIVEAFGGLGAGLGAAIGAPPAQYGGIVKRTGLAVVHKGEELSGVGRLAAQKFDIHIHNEGAEKLEVSGAAEYTLSDRRIVDVTLKAIETDVNYRRTIKRVR